MATHTHTDTPAAIHVPCGGGTLESLERTIGSAKRVVTEALGGMRNALKLFVRHIFAAVAQLVGLFHNALFQFMGFGFSLGYRFIQSILGPISVLNGFVTDFGACLFTGLRGHEQGGSRPDQSTNQEAGDHRFGGTGCVRNIKRIIVLTVFHIPLLFY